MPELPEVETIRRQLEPLLIGRVVTESGSHPSPKFAEAPAVVGARIEFVRRRGKYLLIALDNDRELVIHLGMTGRFVVRSAADDSPLDPFVRAWWHFDDGSALAYQDVRRFGRIAVVDAGEYRRLPTLHRLGPEPFDESFTGAALWAAIRCSNTRVKTQLLNQRVVAGVGNIYADEALWAARVNPAARRITKPQAVRLLDAIRQALEAGIANGGTTLRDYRTVDGREGTNQYSLRCYGRFGEPCGRCGTSLRRRIIDGRSTTWCPACQRR